jgi:hypothetical protein
LCTSALAQPSGAATALEVNRHGIGHMLIVPYFSAQGGNTTLLNIFNASDTAKAVKVRFRGAGNGDELASFQVFLNAFDAWTVNISSGAGGLPVLATIDRSCTVPAAINGQQFSISRLNPAMTGTLRANQAREGYIEIIAMGDVIRDTPLWREMTLSFGAPPCAPSVLGALTRFDPQLAPPSTGLMANWILINVPQTTIWSGEALAYEARHDGLASTGNNVFFPHAESPLTSADVAQYTADPLFNFANGGPVVTPTSRDLPDLSTPYTSPVTAPQHQANELSFEIAAQRSAVEFFTDPTVQATTDWVASMPTRRYYAAVDYRGPTLITNRGSFGADSAVYFSRLSDRDVSSSGQSCYVTMVFQFLMTLYDRESNLLSSELAPGILGQQITFCGMVSVFSVFDSKGAASPTLKAAATRTSVPESAAIVLAGKDGLAVLKWTVLDATEKGQPVLVRQFSRAINPSVAPGISGTYGFSWAGRTLVPGVWPN